MSANQSFDPHTGPQPGGGASSSLNDAPPSAAPHVSDAPMTGEPVKDSEATMWAMFSHLAVVLGHFAAVLGWVGPLVIFLMYKDRNRFIRFHAAEALNGAIATLVLSIALSIVLTITAVVTLGFGSFLMPLAGAPQLVQIIFAIIGAVKANNREWWSYPVNLRFVK